MAFRNHPLCLLCSHQNPPNVQPIEPRSIQERLDIFGLPARMRSSPGDLVCQAALQNKSTRVKLCVVSSRPPPQTAVVPDLAHWTAHIPPWHLCMKPGSSSCCKSRANGGVQARSTPCRACTTSKSWVQWYRKSAARFAICASKCTTCGLNCRVSADEVGAPRSRSFLSP